MKKLKKYMSFLLFACLFVIQQKAEAYTPNPKEGWVPYDTTAQIPSKNPGDYPAASQPKKNTQATNREFIYDFSNSDRLYYRFGIMSNYTTSYEENEPEQMLSAHRDLSFAYNLRKYPGTPGDTPDTTTNGDKSDHSTFSPVRQQQFAYAIGSNMAMQYSPSFDLVIDGIDVLVGSNNPDSPNALGTSSGSANLKGNKNGARNEMKVKSIYTREPDPNNPDNDALGIDIMQISEYKKIEMVKTSYILGSTIMTEYKIINNDTVDHTIFARSAIYSQQRVWSQGPNQGFYINRSSTVTKADGTSGVPIELRALTYYPAGATPEESFDKYGVTTNKTYLQGNQYSLQAHLPDRTATMLQPKFSANQSAPLNQYIGMAQNLLPKGVEMYSSMGTAGGTGATSGWQVDGQFAMTPVGVLKAGESFSYKRNMELTNNNAKKMNWNLDKKFEQEIIVLKGEDVDIYGTYQSQYDKNLTFLLAGSSPTTKTTIDAKGIIPLKYDPNKWPDDIDEQNWSTKLNTRNLEIGTYDVALTGVGDYSGSLGGIRNVKLKVVTAPQATVVPGYVSKYEILEMKDGKIPPTLTDFSQFFQNVSDDLDDPKDLKYSPNPRQDFNSLTNEGIHTLLVDIENSQGGIKTFSVPIYVLMQSNHPYSQKQAAIWERSFIGNNLFPGYSTNTKTRDKAMTLDYAGISAKNYNPIASSKERIQFLHQEATNLEFYWIEGNSFKSTKSTSLTTFFQQFPKLFEPKTNGRLEFLFEPASHTSTLWPYHKDFNDLFLGLSISDEIPNPPLEMFNYMYTPYVVGTLDNQGHLPDTTWANVGAFTLEQGGIFYFLDETPPTADAKPFVLNHIDDPFPQAKDLIQNLTDVRNPIQDVDKIKVKWNDKNKEEDIRKMIREVYNNGGKFDVLIDITDDAGNTATISSSIETGSLTFTNSLAILDFGEKKISAETKGRFNVSEYKGMLSVEDKRPTRAAWKLGVKMLSPFKNENGKPANIFFKYNDGANDKTLNDSTNYIHVEKGITATSNNLWDLTSVWKDNKNTSGFYLDIDQGAIQYAGEYSADIEFSLEDAPTN